MQYRARPELGFLTPFLNSGFINFATDIQPYYPDITEEMYFTQISAISSVWGSLDSMAQFFNITNGLVSYNYSYIDPNNRFNGVIQTIVYKDKDAYDQWQNNENNRAENTTSKISMNLSENGGFDASTFVLDGIVKTNTSTGITKELTLGQFLTTKFKMLRNTLCTIVHSTIE
jgi:hypothetical protein